MKSNVFEFCSEKDAVAMEIAKILFVFLSICALVDALAVDILFYKIYGSDSSMQIRIWPRSSLHIFGATEKSSKALSIEEGCLLTSHKVHRKTE